MTSISKRRTGCAVAIASVAALALAACGSDSNTTGGGSSGTANGSTASNSNISIAGVYGLTYDPFWVSLGCGAQEEAKRLGVKYKAYSSNSGETSAFAQSFSSAQLTTPNGVFVNPSNPNQFVSQYKSLMAKGVPVVTINGSSPASQYKVVGTDVKDTSFLDDVAKLVTDDSGSMAVVDGIPGLVPVQVRLQPVVKAIRSAHSGLKMLKTIYSGFDINKATQSVSSLILANSDLKVIVAADGPDGQAAAAAVKQAGKTGQIKIIALDAIPTEVAALKDGTITGLVAQSPEQIGRKQVSTLVQYIQAKKTGAVPASADTVGVPQRLLTKSNVGSSDNSDYVYKTKC